MNIPKILNRLLKIASKPHWFALKNRDITIISNNCIAGFIFKDLGIPYNSPTIGLQFTQQGFVEFCRDFYNYIELPITENDEPQEEAFRCLGG
jgi:uncharacterized protein (DUF1919 family)